MLYACCIQKVTKDFTHVVCKTYIKHSPWSLVSNLQSKSPTTFAWDQRKGTVWYMMSLIKVFICSSFNLLADILNLWQHNLLLHKAFLLIKLVVLSSWLLQEAKSADPDYRPFLNLYFPEKYPGLGEFWPSTCRHCLDISLCCSTSNKSDHCNKHQLPATW